MTTPRSPKRRRRYGTGKLLRKRATSVPKPKAPRSEARAPWTPEERALLERLWQDVPITEAVKALGRTPSAITQRAAEEGLPTGQPQGTVSLAAIMREQRCGRTRALRVLVWAGVRVAVANTVWHPRYGGRRKVLAIDRDAYLDAFRRWEEEAWTMLRAASELRVAKPARVREACLAVGVLDPEDIAPGRRYRYDSRAMPEDVLFAWHYVHDTEPRDGRVSADAAEAELGVSRNTMIRAARAAGFLRYRTDHGLGYWLRMEDWRAALAYYAGLPVTTASVAAQRDALRAHVVERLGMGAP